MLKHYTILFVFLLLQQGYLYAVRVAVPKSGCNKSYHLKNSSLQSTSVVSSKTAFLKRNVSSCKSESRLVSVHQLITKNFDPNFDLNLQILSEALDSDKVDLRARDIHGNTALACAIIHLNLPMFYLLVSKTTDLGFVGYEHLFDKVAKDCIKNVHLGNGKRVPFNEDLEEALATVAHMRAEYIRQKESQLN